MSSTTSPPNMEERAVGILFCSIAASGTPDNPSPEVVPQLKASFDALLRPVLTQHKGIFVDAVGDTSIAIFDSAAAAVEAALGLRDGLSERPLVAESQRLRLRLAVHHAPAAVEQVSSTIARISGEGVRFTARLLRRVPEDGIGLSDSACRGLPKALGQAFVSVLVDKDNLILGRVFSTGPQDPNLLYLWLDRKAFDRFQAAASPGISVGTLPPAAAPGRTASPRSPAPASPPAASDFASLFDGAIPAAPAPFRPAAPSPAPAPVPAAGKALTRQWKPGALNRVRTNEARPDLETLDFGSSPTQDALDDDSPIDYASEAIVVIDIVQATATSDLYGWYSVGRRMVQYLRKAVRQIGASYGLACMKSTGDGLLLTYRDTRAADIAAVNAVRASLDLLERLSELNELAPEERRIALRFALHFGEVDVLPDDREGPNVSFTFRVEAINHASLSKAFNPIDPALLPERDYILCSERVHDIVTRRKPDWGGGSDGFFNSCGFFKLKGFTALHEVFLVSGQPGLDA